MKGRRSDSARLQNLSAKWRITSWAAGINIGANKDSVDRSCMIM